MLVISHVFSSPLLPSAAPEEFVGLLCNSVLSMEYPVLENVEIVQTFFKFIISPVISEPLSSGT